MLNNDQIKAFANISFYCRVNSFQTPLMKEFLLFATSFLFFLHSFGATITGTISDDKGTPLPFASVSVKGSSKGAIANSQGKYAITLDVGTYNLVCQHIGYKTVEKTITVSEEKLVVEFVLSLQDLKMEEVVIKRGEDPAVEIMRKTIAKREFYNKQTDSFTVDVYIKGLMRSRNIPDRVLGQKVDKSEFSKQGLDSNGKGILFLSESITKVAYKHPDKIKFEVVSSRESGGGFGFFDFLYHNSVRIIA